MRVPKSGKKQRRQGGFPARQDHPVVAHVGKIIDEPAHLLFGEVHARGWVRAKSTVLIAVARELEIAEVRHAAFIPCATAEISACVGFPPQRLARLAILLQRPCAPPASARHGVVRPPPGIDSFLNRRVLLRLLPGAQRIQALCRGWMGLQGTPAIVEERFESLRPLGITGPVPQPPARASLHMTRERNRQEVDVSSDQKRCPVGRQLARSIPGAKGSQRARINGDGPDAGSDVAPSDARNIHADS